MNKIKYFLLLSLCFSSLSYASCEEENAEDFLPFSSILDISVESFFPLRDFENDFSPGDFQEKAKFGHVSSIYHIGTEFEKKGELLEALKHYIWALQQDWSQRGEFSPDIRKSLCDLKTLFLKEAPKASRGKSTRGQRKRRGRNTRQRRGNNAPQRPFLPLKKDYLLIKKQNNSLQSFLHVLEERTTKKPPFFDLYPDGMSNNFDFIEENKTNWFMREGFLTQKEKDFKKQYFLYRQFSLLSLDALRTVCADRYSSEQERGCARFFLEKSESEDDADTQYDLGTMYFHGTGGERNFEKAIEHCQKAARKGHPGALYFLGVIYFNGEGGERNLLKAKEYFERAAQAGHPAAKEDLSMTLQLLAGVTLDVDKDLGALKETARRGSNPQAQCELGLLYYNGDGVGKDHVEAKKWFKLSAEQEHPISQYFLGAMAYSEDGNLEEARGWMEQSALQGYPAAQYYFGEMNFYGYGADRDLYKAREYFEKVVQREENSTTFQEEYLKAQEMLAEMCCTGQGGEVDHPKSRQLLEKMAPLGKPYIQFNLGMMCERGEGGEQSINQAVYWYEQAAGGGSLSAKHNLGVIFYRDGNFVEARKYFEEAAQQENPESIYALGVMHALGKGGDQNLEEALDLLDRAKDLNPDLKYLYVYQSFLQKLEENSESSQSFEEEEEIKNTINFESVDSVLLEDRPHSRLKCNTV